jgi:hypothetical protein
MYQEVDRRNKFFFNGVHHSASCAPFISCFHLFSRTPTPDKHVLVISTLLAEN